MTEYQPLTNDQVTRMAWKGLLLDARTDPDNPDYVRKPLGEDEVYVSSLTSDCPRWAYYKDKEGFSGMNLTSIFKTSIGTILHRTKFFENAEMEGRVNHEGIRGRLDSYDPARNILYEVKTTKNDKVKYPKPNDHHVSQVLIYWALMYKMKGIIANQAFLLYVVFPAERLLAFEVKLPKRKNQTDAEALEQIWEKTIAKKELLCACRKVGIPPEPVWGKWGCNYCEYNEDCIMNSPYHIKPMLMEQEENGEEMD
jgi:CRISPR/Cas system-associated exonuclease Cas4 (RecB family)